MVVGVHMRTKVAEITAQHISDIKSWEMMRMRTCAQNRFWFAKPLTTQPRPNSQPQLILRTYAAMHTWKRVTATTCAHIGPLKYARQTEEEGAGRGGGGGGVQI